jgi:signal peptidase II
LIFIIANIVLIGLVTIILFTKFNKVNKTTIVSLVLVIAGGIGNLVDRIFRGYVIDYIDINQLFKYPIFNFVDICVVVGITLIIICVLVHKGEY